MTISELITKLLHIERDLIEQGIDLNKVEVLIIKYDNETVSNYSAELNDIEIENNNINLNSY